MLKKITILFLVLSIFSCKHDKKVEGTGAIVIFSSLQEGRGNVVASVDGEEIKSGDRVSKGKIVSFTATPESDRYVIRKWKGASYDESSINEALLKIKDENETYAVRVDFGDVVNFMRINSGEVKGSPVVPDITKERLNQIIKEQPQIRVRGPNITIVVASTDVAWDQGGFKVNGKEGESRRSQATKGIRRMPWRQESKKDAISCEKLWGAANRHRSTDIRMGQPTGCNGPVSERKTDLLN